MQQTRSELHYPRFPAELAPGRKGRSYWPIRCKASFAPEALLANVTAVLDELQRAKPSASKGKYMRKITISSTMGPGVKIDTGRLKPEA